MNLLGVDVGSSSVKAGVLHNGKLIGKPVRASFATHYTVDRAEVDSKAILRAVAQAIHALGPRARKADVIAMTTMAPSWLAMDRKGNAITPIVTHQDRRSVEESKHLISQFGKARLLKLSGNLPFPGGISSSTWLWFNRHAKSLMKKADLVGHLQTFLHRQFSNSRIVDPSNAAFMGLYGTLKLNGWNDELCDAVGATQHQLPQLVAADGVAGMVSRSAGERFGLTHGTPMLVGCIDTSAATLLAGAEPGHLLNVSGSTDVLALCTDQPIAHANLLTRPLGTGPRWLSVCTLAAAGSALSWAKDQLYSDYSIEKFFNCVDTLTDDAVHERGEVKFEPYLAGERAAVDQRTAAFNGLTLSTTRRQMLAAIIDALAIASAARLELLKINKVRISGNVTTSGGAAKPLHRLLTRDWPGKWTFKFEEEATLRGLAKLAE